MDFASLLPSKQRLLPLTISLSTALNLAHWNPIPAKYRAAHRAAPPSATRLRTHFPRADDLTRLRTSFSVLDSVRALQRKRWGPLDLQYIALAAVVLVSLVFSPPAPLLKMAAVLGALLLGFMPVTRQFFWPGFTIWVYLIFFFSSRYV